ncbi:CRISPR-associated endonuclease Cas2 [Kurthia populi]|uniref:CRISPR-associated endoribonuclease Cas2 n=1 Tax=Kurthia populi TaxID=1562132 RepID=A0ABW5XZ07_9BACL
MLILVTYDVSTQTAEGRTRLRKVAKVCQNYGVRVQNSVFECIVDATQLLMMKKELDDMINKGTDSLRFYNLGNKYKSKVEHIGAKESIHVEEPLIF